MRRSVIGYLTAEDGGRWTVERGPVGENGRRSKMLATRYQNSQFDAGKN
jgi:hypothetical protein